MKFVYPAVFYPDKDGSYAVVIPDLNELATQGNDLANAIDMAEDACGLYVYTSMKDGEKIPEASDISHIKTDEEGTFVSLISVDMTEYAKKHNEKAIKKTLTIPAWLNTRAEEANINFSAVLQEALQQKLFTEAH